MAITRIKNNQITDASAGNIYVGVNAASKLQDYSITSAKIANDLTYNSSLTITGNLTVQGNTTQIDTTNLVVEDPIFILASEQTGTPALDIGFIGERGDEDNITFIWDESADTFVTAFTTDLVTNTTVTISSFADFKANNIVANGTFQANGTSTLIGNTTMGNLEVEANKVIIVGAGSTTDFNLINLSNVADPVGAQDVATKNYVDSSLSSIFTLEDDATNTTTVADGDTVQMLGTANEVDVVVGNLSVTFGLPDDVTIGNTLTVTDEVNATGNISGANLAIVDAITAGTTIVATGNITGGNIDTGGQIIATGNITGANLDIGNGITAGTTIVAVGNIDGDNLNASNAITAGTTIDAVGNITGGNIITTGVVQTGTLETTGNALIGGNLVVQGNITYINIDDLRVEDPIIILGTGPNGAPLTVNDGKDRGVFMEYYTTGLGNAFMGWDNSTGNMVIANDAYFTGNDVVGINAYGTLEVGNVYGESAVFVGNVDCGNLNSAGAVIGNVEITGNLELGNLSVTGVIDATGNITGGNLVTSNLVSGANVQATSLTANRVVYVGADSYLVDSANFTFDGTNANLQGQMIIDNFTIDGTSITSDANLTITSSSDGNVDITPNGTGVVNIDNITIADNTIGSSTGNIVVDPSANIVLPDETASAVLYLTADKEVQTDANLTYNGTNVQLLNGNIGVGDAVANVFVTNEGIQGTGTLVINQDSSDVDFAVNGDTNANIFYIDAGTETASFGNATQTTGAIVAFNTNSSILVPVGNSATRPSGVTGMVRFNTTLDSLEFYDADSWVSAGTVFTVIDSEVFNGDGSTVAFTLGSDQTTDSCIVSINGVVQIPVVAYAVSGNVMTFTEAPLSQDVIEVREITTTVTVKAISNSTGNAIIEVEDTSSNVYITGNVTPTSNVAFNLGSDTNRFNELFLAGGSITLGNIILKNETGNTLAFYGPDGTTPGTLSSNNVDTTTIANGTSNVSCATSNGNVNVNVGGAGIVNFNANGIDNLLSNGVGNIGTSSSYFNTIFAKATSAQYADLAEMYEADAAYEPGTVLCFGGAKEVTLCSQADCTRVAGVVSTNPSYLMNSGQTGDNVVAVALQGRVPCRVTGTVRKGDLIVSTGDGRGRANNDARVGTVIGKALADFDGADGVIEVVVGRV
jgi:hypothetical protein